MKQVGYMRGNDGGLWTRHEAGTLVRGLEDSTAKLEADELAEQLRWPREESNLRHPASWMASHQGAGPDLSQGPAQCGVHMVGSQQRVARQGVGGRGRTRARSDGTWPQICAYKRSGRMPCAPQIIRREE